MTDRERGIKMLQLAWKGADSPLWQYDRKDSNGHYTVRLWTGRWAQAVIFVGKGSRLTTAARRAIAKWEKHCGKSNG